LTLYLARVLIHRRFYFGKVHLDIIKNTLFKCPAEKVELSHCGLEHRKARDLEHDALTPTEGVKQLFAVGLQLRFVVRIDEELLPIHYIGDVVLLGIVGDEPVNETQRYLGCALEESEHLVLVLAGRVETLQAAHDQLLFAVYLATPRLGIRILLNNGKTVKHLHLR